MEYHDHEPPFRAEPAAPMSPPHEHFWRTVEESGKWITECETCGIEREVAPVSPEPPRCKQLKVAVHVEANDRIWLRIAGCDIPRSFSRREIKELCCACLIIDSEVREDVKLWLNV